MKNWIFPLSLALLSNIACSSDPLESANVVWTSPSTDSSGSMPIGNGDLGANVWVEQNGDLVFFLAKPDLYSENLRLLKLGRVRISFANSPFKPSDSFRQELRLKEGEILITGGTAAKPSKIRVWVDANHPVMRVDVDSVIPLLATVNAEVYRNAPYTGPTDSAHPFFSMSLCPHTFQDSADLTSTSIPDALVWYHRNTSSCFNETMALQSLTGFGAEDPLINRTFGGLIEGDGFIRKNSTSLQSRTPSQKFSVRVHALTQQAPSASSWISAINNQANATKALNYEACLEAHRTWWNDFWSRTYVRISAKSGSTQQQQSDASIVNKVYALQRMMNAAGGRGAYPIKFNGSIFTTENREPDNTDPKDPDYRKWGDPFWFQNTRLVYWSMLANGDFDLMQPFFNFYRSILDLCAYRCQVYYNHAGAYYPETLNITGANVNRVYGWDRTGLSVDYLVNPAVRYHINGSLELMSMQLQYYDYTGDTNFLNNVLLPTADQVLTFYKLHYPLSSGKMYIKPSQALEAYRSSDVLNPMPEVAGLSYVVEELLKLPDSVLGGRKATWQALQATIPAIPTRLSGSTTLLSPAQVYTPRTPTESPELYAIFPYRRYGLLKPNLQMAVDTYNNRINRNNYGWNQDVIQASMLGLVDDSKNMIIGRAKNKHVRSRFDGFFGPNYDWIPDQQHANIMNMAIHNLLVQWEGSNIVLFPAWPKDWNVEFKLRVPGNATVQAKYEDGVIVSWSITPSEKTPNVEVRQPR